VLYDDGKIACDEWWNLDPERNKKELALVIDTGHHIRPTITPDDPQAVERILTERAAK
jgi:hypothetical protein